MHRIILLLLLTASAECLAQHAIIDTTYLLKDNTDGVLHSVFVEPSRNSAYYGYISDYTFGDFDSGTYNESLEYLRKHRLKLGKVQIKDLPKDWIMIKQYKDNFYAYSPSDYYSHYKVRITDTSFIDFSGEGPSASKISDFKRVDNNTFLFELKGMYSHGRDLLIHVINEEAGIAVFEDSSKERGKTYYLMADSAKIRDLPLIVNYSNMKQVEFEFDRTDFKKLIQHQ